MIDLAVDYLGLPLRSPLVVSASPLTTEIPRLRALEENNAGAIVMHSLFEEQIRLESDEMDRFLNAGTEAYFEATTYLPEPRTPNLGPLLYLRQVERAKRAVAIPVIGSLNGVSRGGWIRYAGEIQDAGADALELNMYQLPVRFDVPGKDIELEYCDLVADIRARLRIPLAVKISAYFTSLPHFARRLEKAGADSLVLFNRFYQPDFDLETLDVEPRLQLSSPEELRLRLHWVAMLFENVGCHLAVTGGVHSGSDALKGILAGAHAIMTTSALLSKGPGHLRVMEQEMRAWMEEHGYSSAAEMRGAMSARRAGSAAFVRANYMKVLSGYVMRGA